MPTAPSRPSTGSALPAHRQVLGMRVDATSYEGAAGLVVDWSRQSVGRYVCVANVHMTMEAYDSPEFRQIVNSAALVTPDGMPLVWMLRRLGIPAQARVYGPTLMLRVCEAAEAAGVPIGLYGGTPDSLVKMRSYLNEHYPRLNVAYAYPPPFRPLTPEEDAEVVAGINASGARILFVGLGCPKQERWMAAHQAALPLVQLGVGAAFDFHSGRVRQAPKWMQDSGLEWLFRLAAEPRRLFRRYAVQNPRFAVMAGWQLLVLTKRRGPPADESP